MKIVGNVPQVNRIQTGLHSFDRAFINADGDIGFPIGKGVELFGQTHVGKSTIVYSLAGMIANELEGNIALADFEGFDPIFLETVLTNSGFDGILYYIQTNEDEEALDELISSLRNEKNKCIVGIVDSIGAISPISEAEGSLGEANMGKRAFLVAQFARKGLKLLRDPNPRTIFMINHAYPVIGGRGLTSPGGEVKKYLASIRIQVKRKYVSGGYEEFPDGSYVILGQVVKNRWGLKDRTFHLFVLSGKGVSKELTAVYDCLVMKLAKKDRVIKIGDQSFGYLKNIVDEARAGNTDFFQPFFELLSQHKDTDTIENQEDAD
jgi:RecA/RadA recombinase